MPTEECTYVKKPFNFEMFANLHRFNYKKMYLGRKLIKIDLCLLNFINMMANLHCLITKKLNLCRKFMELLHF